MPGSHRDGSTQTAEETHTALKTVADAQPVIVASDIPPLARDATVIALLGPKCLPYHTNITSLTLLYPDEPGALPYFPGTVPCGDVSGKLASWFKLILVQLPQLTRLALKPTHGVAPANCNFAYDIEGTFHIRTFVDESGMDLMVVSYRSTSCHSPLGPHNIPTYHWEAPEGRAEARWEVPSGAYMQHGEAEWRYLADYFMGPIPIPLLHRCLDEGTCTGEVKGITSSGDQQAGRGGRSQSHKEQDVLDRYEGRGDHLTKELWDEMWVWYKAKERDGWATRAAEGW